MNLKNRLAEARKNKGLTQAQVADLLFLTTQSISSWEQGHSIPDTDKIPELAELYGVTTDWLLLGKEPSEEVKKVTEDLSDRLFNESRMGTYVNAYCDAKKLYETKRALAFAKNKHDGQYRKEGHSNERIPYIYHPLLLTCHALALGMEEDNLLAACLLHDVCEDCGVEADDLPFDDEVKDAVRLVTKPKDYNGSEEDRKAYYDGIAGNRIAMIVKILDRCNNVSSMATSFSDNRMAEYIMETHQYIHPLIEKVRDEYPQYSNQMFLIRYHMNSVLEALRHHMRSSIE